MFTCGDLVPATTMRERIKVSGNSSSLAAEIVRHSSLKNAAGKRLQALWREWHKSWGDDCAGANRKEGFCVLPMTTEDIKDEVSSVDVLQNLRRDEAAAFRRFIQENPVYIATPSHPPIELSGQIIGGRVSGREGQNGAIEWDFFEDSFLSIKVEHLLRKLSALETLGETGTLVNFQRRELEDLRVRLPVIKALLPHQGWFMFVRNVALDESHMRRLYRIEGADTGLGSSQAVEGASRGRPRKQEMALEIYDSRFPKGHNGYTWKEVARILDVEEGFRVSVDTLKNALLSRDISGK